MNKYWAAVIGLSLGACVVAALVARPIIRDARIAATHSTVESVYSSLQRTNAIDEADDLQDEWRVLADDEYDRIVSRLERRHKSIDAGRFSWTSRGVLIDQWGTRLRIAGRRINRLELSYIVWSKGPDGVSGTSDDLVVPKEMAETVSELVDVY